MSALHEHTPRTPERDAEPGRQGGRSPGHHHGHGWMMIVCCIPMLIIAVALVAAGVLSWGFLIFALACTAVMALMMRAMPGSSDKHDQHR